MPDILESNVRKNTTRVGSRAPKTNVLPITLDPKKSADFKNELLVHRVAEIETFYSDGLRDKSIWKANKFKESSNVLGNLRGWPNFRQGKWQELGIEKIHVSIKKK
jgi:hypothetical protein